MKNSFKSGRIRTGSVIGLAVAMLVAGCTGTAVPKKVNAAAGATGWCSGVNIAAFPGGPQGGVFANNVYNGFKQAAADLGPTVKYYFSNWDPNILTSQMKEALATKPDGMAIYGFAGPEATTPIVDQAHKDLSLIHI